MAKRITKSVVNWVELEKIAPPEQKGNFFAFKGKSEAYLRRMLLNPPEPPPIKWDLYKKQVPVPGLVEKFQAEYTALKVPYPQDKLTPLVDEQWAKLQPEILKFTEVMKKHIAKMEKEIARVNALPEFEDMTMEMVRDTYPDIAPDFVNRPSFWPHTDDEQLGYYDPTQKI